MEASSSIDFDVISLASIKDFDSQLVLTFPHQPLFSFESDGELVVCKLIVERGAVVLKETNTPETFDDFEVNYKGGSRSSLLPIEFKEEGPIELIFWKNEDKLLQVVGSAIELKMYE